MKEMIKLGIILLLFSAISAGALALTNEVTAPAIASSRQAADLENRQQVFSDADEFTQVSEEELAQYKKLSPELAELFVAKKSGEKVGYVAKVVTGAFGGNMEIILGFEEGGNIIGMRVGQHSETPGLGDNANEPDFYEQFSGLDLGQDISLGSGGKASNEIEAISAATITSNAIINGVNGLAKLLGGLK